MEQRMTYCKYKTSYSDCKTVQGTYDKGSKTIVVIIPEGRMKKSGVRGQKFNYYTFYGVNRITGKSVKVTVKAICGENAIKQLHRDYDKNIEWDLNY